ncbi:hypothetical protein M5K25_011438 [Dendrobium thyrsiflorum]|uniref:Uncharacterized protein n=1 Tax=Dendrobium thyrsiflorum TaxID=117978 RepID=A0ABD0V321_DENTH
MGLVPVVSRPRSESLARSSSTLSLEAIFLSLSLSLPRNEHCGLEEKWSGLAYIVSCWPRKSKLANEEGQPFPDYNPTDLRYSSIMASTKSLSSNIIGMPTLQLQRFTTACDRSAAVGRPEIGESFDALSILELHLTVDHHWTFVWPQTAIRPIPGSGSPSDLSPTAIGLQTIVARLRSHRPLSLDYDPSNLRLPPITVPPSSIAHILQFLRPSSPTDYGPSDLGI